MDLEEDMATALRGDTDRRDGMPLVIVAPDNDVDALQRAIELCCRAGALQLPPGGVFVTPKEMTDPDGVRPGRLLAWERGLGPRGAMALPVHLGPTPQYLWWLSFVDPDQCDPAGGEPGGRGFLGVSIVTAPSYMEAIQAAHRLGCNPGGDVQGSGPFPADAVPDQYLNRLLTKTEADAVFQDQPDD